MADSLLVTEQGQAKDDWHLADLGSPLFLHGRHRFLLRSTPAWFLPVFTQLSAWYLHRLGVCSSRLIFISLNCIAGSISVSFGISPWSTWAWGMNAERNASTESNV